MNDRLLHISLTDGLTGVDNRRALEQRLQRCSSTRCGSMSRSPA